MILVCGCSVCMSAPFSPVATDSGGINTDELEKALESKVGQRQRELTDRRPFWGMLYLVSTIHNPTGVSLTTGELATISSSLVHTM